MKKFFSLLMTFILLFLLVVPLTACSGQKKTGPYAELLQIKTSEDKMYIIDGKKLSNAEYMMIASLQGNNSSE